MLNEPHFRSEIQTVRSTDQDMLGFLRPGFHTLLPQQAQTALDACRYIGQTRDLTKSGKDHVSVLADLMRRSIWRPFDKLDFAELDDQIILVNGHHRLQAQIDANVKIPWTLVFHRCLSQSDVDELYYSFDTNTRIRTSSQILTANGFAENMGLQKTIASAMFRAMPLILAKLNTSKSERDVVKFRAIDLRINAAKEYVDEAKAFQECVKPAKEALKLALLTQGALSVALVTLRHQKAKAVSFWSGVADIAKIENPFEGDPRVLYNQLLLNVRGLKGSGSAGYTIALAADSWNKWFLGKSVKEVRARMGRPLKLLGTPFDGR